MELAGAIRFTYSSNNVCHNIQKSDRQLNLSAVNPDLQRPRLLFPRLTQYLSPSNFESGSAFLERLCCTHGILQSVESLATVICRVASQSPNLLFQPNHRLSGLESLTDLSGSTSNALDSICARLTQSLSNGPLASFYASWNHNEAHLIEFAKTQRSPMVNDHQNSTMLPLRIRF